MQLETVSFHTYIYMLLITQFLISNIQTNYTDIASGSGPPVENSWCAPARNISINKLIMCVLIPSPYILTNEIQLYTGRVLSMHDT